MTSNQKKTKEIKEKEDSKDNNKAEKRRLISENHKKCLSHTRALGSLRLLEQLITVLKPQTLWVGSTTFRQQLIRTGYLITIYCIS